MSPTIVLDGRRAVPGARLAGRRDDHHHRAADAGQPHRPGHDAAGGDGGAARVAAQQRRAAGRAGLPQRPGRAGPDALGHTFAPTAELGAATGIEFGPGGRLIAAAEPVRRGGGAAGVVRPGADPRVRIQHDIARCERCRRRYAVGSGRPGGADRLSPTGAGTISDGAGNPTYDVGAVRHAVRSSWRWVETRLGAVIRGRFIRFDEVRGYGFITPDVVAKMSLCTRM